MRVSIKGLAVFQNLGDVIVQAAHRGMKDLAEFIKQRLRSTTPKWYGETLTIQERELGKIYVGPTIWVPEDDTEGSTVDKKTCGDFKFRIPTVKHNRGDVTPYLMQMKDEMISSGQAKSIILERIVADVRALLG